MGLWLGTHQLLNCLWLMFIFVAVHGTTNIKHLESLTAKIYGGMSNTLYSYLLVNVQPLVRVSNLIGAQHYKAQSL